VLDTGNRSSPRPFCQGGRTRSGAHVDVENLRAIWILVHSLHPRERATLAFWLMMFIVLGYGWSLVTNLASCRRVLAFDDVLNYFEF
jgi:hypothetical protein